MVRFDMMVVPVKPEPDAVYDFSGKIVGYKTASGSGLVSASSGVLEPHFVAGGHPPPVRIDEVKSL